MSLVSSMSPGTYAVRICSGRHAGAEVGLTRGSYVLGSGAEADIVVTDDGIARRHVELSPREDYCRVWSIDGGVRVGDRLLGPGAKVDVKLPSELLAGSVRISVSPPFALKTESIRRRKPMTVGLTALLVLGGGGMLLMSSGLSAFGMSAHAVKVPMGDAADVRSGAISPVLPAVATSTNSMASLPGSAPGEGGAAGAAAALAGELEKLGLAGMVTVRAEGDMVEAMGNVPPAQAQAWADAEMWFDQAFKGAYALVHHVGVAEAALPPRVPIQAIWAGSIPYVIGGDGEKYGQGAMLPGGWRVETISREQVVVSRQGERLSLTP